MALISFLSRGMSDMRTLAGSMLLLPATRTKKDGTMRQSSRRGEISVPSRSVACPVKECPLIPTLSRIGVPKKDYISDEDRCRKGDPLEDGNKTCFGGLSRRCKTSSPCMFRDITLRQAGLTKKEYMRLKRELSDTIMSRVFHDVPADNQPLNGRNLQ